MSAAGFTARQRATIILMAILIVVAFAMFAGFIITSLQSQSTPPPAIQSTAKPTLTASATPIPASPTSPPDAPEPAEGLGSQVQAARLFDQIAHQVEVQRDLTPRAEMPLSFLDEQDMTRILRQLHAGQDHAARLSPYIELGVLPDASLFTRPQQTPGLYAPQQRQIYILTGRHESSVDEQALLAHAYIHALQDQRFDLGAMDARAQSTDAALAIQALVEGDAMLTTALYRYGDLAATDWPRLTALIIQAEQPQYSDKLEEAAHWERIQRFPYWEGRQFGEALLQAGGWEALNRAYANPPRSTEYILHPERYLADSDQATRVTVPDLSDALGPDWTLSIQDTFGEFVISLYLEALSPTEEAREIADGWNGDTFVKWRDGAARQAVVWRTFWDSAADAVAFETALRQMIGQKYLPAWPVAPPGGLIGTWWKIEGGAVYVARVAHYVTLAQAPDLDTLTDIAHALP